MLELAFIANNDSNDLLVSTSGDGVNWDGNSQVQGQSSQTSPCLALFSSGTTAFVLAFVANNPSNDLLVSSSADGLNWDGNSQVQGQTTKAAPSLAVFKDRIWLAFVANNPSNDLLVTSSADGVNWDGNSQVQGQTSQTAPSLAVAGGRLWLAFVANNPSNDLLVSSSADGLNWDGNSQVQGQTTKAAPSLVGLGGVE